MNGNSRQPKAKKKRKPVKECPNPLFLSWLERWRDEAKANESKLQYVYNKAVSSLKKYPLPLESGKEAMILDGIGSGIAKRLDEELEKHNRDCENKVFDIEKLNLSSDSITELPFPDLRVPPPINMIVTSPTVNGILASSDESKPRKKQKSCPREYIPVYRSGPYAIIMALSKASERIGYKGYLTKTELQQQAQQYTETSFTVSEPDSYYTAWSSMSTLIKKGLVMKSGNPARFSLTDSGYTLADKLATATVTHSTTATQSSTTTLSPPAKPKLPNFSPPSTPKTTSVPKPRTPAIPNTSPKVICCPADTTQTVNSPQTRESITISPRYGKPSKDFLASYRYKTSGTEAMPCHLGSLTFWYVGSDGESVDHQDKAAVIIDDEISFGYLVKCKKSELDQAKVKYKLDHCRKGENGHVFVYIDSESITRLTEATKTVVTKMKSNVKTNLISSVSDDDSDDEMLMRPLFERLGGKKDDNEIKTNKVPAHTTSGGSVVVKEPEIISIIEPCKSEVAVTSRPNINKPSLTTTEPVPAQARQAPKDKKLSQTRRPAQTKAITFEEKQFTQNILTNEAKHAACHEPSQTTAASTSCQNTAENLSPQMESNAPKKVEKIIEPEYELEAGSFEIVLCVDFIETTGGSKTTRKEEMVKELKMNGVSFDVRKLNVGDFLWIAREKMLPVPGQLVLPDRRELVLDYIVERKRMDDLCSSIKDGRFKEQKFRLLNSGLKHPVYLVEDFGSMNFMSMPAQTLEQAIVNTQISQGFFVKRTRDIKESAGYLTLMTRYLQTAYENKSVKAIKKDDMECVKVEENQVNTFLMTFQELNDISIKNRILTVGELFGKQLLQIPGVAAEKVVGILDHYPTLRDLLEAYEVQCTEKEKENLLSNIKFGKTQRKIGPSVSKTVYQLYCTKGALS